MLWIFVPLFMFPGACSTTIGNINDHILVGSSNTTLVNVTRQQCLCTMLRSSEPISAANYFLGNRTCQLLSARNTSITIQFYSNTTMSFYNRSSVSIRLQNGATGTTTSSTSTTAAVTSAPLSMLCANTTDSSLTSNQFIYSPTSQTYAAGIMNNLFGIYRANGYQNVTTSTLWVAGQSSTAVDCVLILHGDRNLVVHASSNMQVLWSSSTANGGIGRPFCLKMLDSGNLVLTDGSGTSIWQTYTSG